MSLRADIRLLRLTIERGLLSWEDLEAVPQPTEPGGETRGAAWGPWVTRLIAAGHLDEQALIGLIRQLDPEADEPLPTPEEPKAPVPDNWDRYHIFSRLGSGGMGSVFKAFDPQLNRFVALKFLHTKDRQTAEAFLDEARAQAQVEHPLICQVYEVGEVEGQPYIAMRFIDGRPLLETARDFPLKTKIRLVQQVADALHAAHLKGLIHRDVKPGNILVTTNQKGALRCIVVDFGLAQTLGFRQAQGGEVAGTPDYLAPEQLSGEAVDHRIDIYSLGAVLYELLTGKLPFRGANVGQTLEQIVDTAPEPPSSLDPSIPRDLDAIVLKCLAKQRTERYASSGELLRDLESFLEGEPITAHSAGVPYRAQKWFLRHRWLAAASGLALLTLITLGALSWTAQRRVRQSAELARRFTAQVKEMEASLRYAALLPAHSMSSQPEDLDRRMRRIESEMESVGPLAIGPGNYALGRAYQSQRRYELAKQHLEQAWRAGYRGPEVAAALGQTIGQLYEEAAYASHVQRNTVVAQATRGELERVLRTPALEYLRAGSDDRSGRYVQALIAFYEGQHDSAMAAAQDAAAAQPWFYEARLLVGRIHEARGREAANVGDYQPALDHFGAAKAEYLALSEIARNDPQLPLSRCRCLNHRNEALRALTQLTVVEVDEALTACDRALALDPDYAEAYSLKSRITWRWADEQARRGTDPRPDLTRAIEFATQASEHNPHSSAAYQNRAAAERLVARWEMLRGIDPVPALERAIAAAEAAIEQQPEIAIGHNSLGNAYALLARHFLSRGSNPEQSLERAITSYQRAVELNVTYTPALLNLGVAWTTRADWQLARGQDPAPAIRQALQPLERAIEVNPNFLQLHNNLGNAHHTLALGLLQQGANPTPELEAAAASYRRTLEINPQYAIGLYNLAFIERLRGRWQLANGLDSKAAQDASETAIRAAVEHNAADPENHIEYAELDLQRAASALAVNADPSVVVRGADRSIQQARQLNSDAPRLFYLEALGRRYLAEWNQARNASATELLDQGLALADRAIALNPGLDEAIALRGVLLKLQGRGLPPTQRAEIAERAIETLKAALVANPSLQLEHRNDLTELQQMLDGS